MRIFTAADRKFVEPLQLLLQQASRLDMPVTVYNLGGLGFGIPHEVADDTFHSRGYYTTGNPDWKTRALHKPDIVRDHLTRHGSGWYLDADAIPLRDLTLATDGWDLAITVRRPGEAAAALHPTHREYMGEINAGVLFFQDTPAMNAFLPIWTQETLAAGSDQHALNRLIGIGLPRDGSIVERAGLRVKCLPTDSHNFYYFPESPGAEVRVVHLKNGRWAGLQISG